MSTSASPPDPDSPAESVAETAEKTVQRKQAGLLVLLGVIGVAAVMPFAFALQQEKLAEVTKKTGASLLSLAMVSCAQSSVFVLLSVFAGLYAARRLGLGAPVTLALARGEPAWPVLRRLGELAESGDRDAMHAVLEGLVLLQYGNARDSYKLPGWQEFPEQGNYELVQVVVPALTNIWGAHYWQRHGPDRLAALSGASCGKNCLGYAMQFVPVGKYANPFDWARTGKSDNAFRFENFSFFPVTYTPEVAEAKFIDALQKLSWGEAPGADASSFGAMHAARTGRLALWDAVILSGQTEHWAKQSRPGLAMLRVILDRREDAKWRQEFSAFMAKPAPTGLELWQIQQSLIKRSDADIMAFAQRYTVSDRDLIKRFCTPERSTLGSCQRGQAELARLDAEWAAASARYQAKAEAERAAAAEAQARFEEEQRQKYMAWRKTQKPSFWDQLAGLAEGFDAAMRAGSGTVTVREYDKAGNYLGSREMSRAWAAGSGATPGN